MEMFFLAVAGAAGALVKDVVKDNRLIFPSFKDGSILLGFIGGMITGAAVGYLVDQNPTTAFMSGYAGSQILTELSSRNRKG